MKIAKTGMCQISIFSCDSDAANTNNSAAALAGYRRRHVKIPVAIFHRNHNRISGLHNLVQSHNIWMVNFFHDADL
jgi:hypothetical protein